jgi:hypothetical protein
MANNQNMLEQILTAALSGGGVRGAAPGGMPGGGAGNLGDVLGAFGAWRRADNRRSRNGRLGGLRKPAGRQVARRPAGRLEPAASVASGQHSRRRAVQAPGRPIRLYPAICSRKRATGQGYERPSPLWIGGIGTLAYQAMKRYQGKSGEAARQRYSAASGQRFSSGSRGRTRSALRHGPMRG